MPSEKEEEKEIERPNRLLTSELSQCFLIVVPNIYQNQLIASKKKKKGMKETYLCDSPY